MADAAMHMYTSAIDSLPDVGDPAYSERVGVILAGLRKLLRTMGDAAARSRSTPSVIVSLSGVRAAYDELMADAAHGPGATLGQRLYVARQNAKLTSKEAANGVGTRRDVIDAIESEESASDDDIAKVKDLLAALGG